MEHSPVPAAPLSRAGKGSEGIAHSPVALLPTQIRVRHLDLGIRERHRSHKFHFLSAEVSELGSNPPHHLLVMFLPPVPLRIPPNRRINRLLLRVLPPHGPNSLSKTIILTVFKVLLKTRFKIFIQHQLRFQGSIILLRSVGLCRTL